MPKIALLLEYDGSNFHGFQRQKSLVSVQQCIEDALQVVFGERTTIEGAGRTDAGVHAKGMIVSFFAKYVPNNFHSFIVSLNGLTNPAISILSALQVPDVFHARYCCTEREYEYYILNSRFPHPLFSNRVYWEKYKVDWNVIQKEIKTLVGIHDFSSLTNRSCEINESYEREIISVELLKVPDIHGLFKIRICSNGFLYNMVRVIVGTLMDIGKGVIKNKTLLEIINSKDRKEAGKTLPPTGLYFLRAYYRNYPEIDKLYSPNWFIPVVQV